MSEENKRLREALNYGRTEIREYMKGRRDYSTTLYNTIFTISNKILEAAIEINEFKFAKAFLRRFARIKRDIIDLMKSNMKPGGTKRKIVRYEDTKSITRTALRRMKPIVMRFMKVTDYSLKYLIDKNEQLKVLEQEIKTLMRERRFYDIAEGREDYDGIER